MVRLVASCAAFAIAWLSWGGPARALEDSWTVRQDVELVSRWPVGANGMGEDRVTAVLYQPTSPGTHPAAVIVNSSGGVTAHTDHYYAQVLAKEGMASLVVDSFTPRGVRRTGDDQNRVSQWKSNADAFAGLRWLKQQPWVDPARVIVLGMSRGGEAAYSAALQTLRARLGVGDLAFAAHVAIAPGSCNFPQRNVKTTGGPVFFMLGELDQVQLVGSCMESIERMRRAGTARIRVAVYPGVYHGYEGVSGVTAAPQDWASGDCAGLFERDENFILYRRGSRKPAAKGSQTDYLFRTCLKRGYFVGGDVRVKAQATADLLQFLRDANVLRDEQARAVVPPCAPIRDTLLRLNCERARAGWTGDLVALARGLRKEPGTDPQVVSGLLRLAASRQHPEAQWELALLMRQGRGVERDPVRALALARLAAEAGDPAGMNSYGVMIRDGVGRAASDNEALPWFQRSADLLNAFAMVNLARYHRDGRAGLTRDSKRAEALLRQAVFRDANPWGQVMLAEMIEAGDGPPAAKAEAIALYRAAAEQDMEPDAKARAAEALAKAKGPSQKAR